LNSNSKESGQLPLLEVEELMKKEKKTSSGAEIHNIS
jgi:hypothetical protein